MLLSSRLKVSSIPVGQEGKVVPSLARGDWRRTIDSGYFCFSPGFQLMTTVAVI